MSQLPSLLHSGPQCVLFLYKHVLKQEVAWLNEVERASKPARMPLVLTRDEARKGFEHLTGTHRLMAGLLDGSGLRLMECVRLRVKDIDFGYSQITVRDGVAGFPAAPFEPFRSCSGTRMWRRR